MIALGEDDKHDWIDEHTAIYSFIDDFCGEAMDISSSDDVTCHLELAASWCRHKAPEAKADTLERRKLAWDAWADAALSGTLADAFRFIKGHDRPPLKSVAINGVVKTSNEDILIAETIAKTFLWKKPFDDAYDLMQLLPPSERPHVTPSSVGNLRTASLSNPRSKSVAWDGFHTRHIGLLDDPLLTALGILWAAVETTAINPQQLFGVKAPSHPQEGW